MTLFVNILAAGMILLFLIGLAAGAVVSLLEGIQDGVRTAAPRSRSQAPRGGAPGGGLSATEAARLLRRSP